MKWKSYDFQELEIKNRLKEYTKTISKAAISLKMVSSEFPDLFISFDTYYNHDYVKNLWDSHPGS